MRTKAQPYVRTRFERELIAQQISSLQDASVLNGNLADYWQMRLALVAEAANGQGRVTPWQAALEGSRNITRHWNVNYSSHGWHRYIGRFPPHVIRSLLNIFRVRPGDRMLDPFAGSGTSLVEARLLGIDAEGIELCPLSCLISRAKADLSFPWEQLAETRDEVLAKFTQIQFDRTGLDLELVPDFPNKEKWFSPEPYAELCGLLQSISMVGNRRARDFCLVALSSIMRSIGNVDVDVVRAEYRKEHRVHVDVARLFGRRITRFVQDLQAFQAFTDVPKSSVQVRLGDARKTDRIAKPANFIMTSPPYGIESISYLRTHLLSYWALHRFLDSDPVQVGEQVIGSEYLQKSDDTLPTIPSDHANAFFRKFPRAEGNDQRRIHESKRYFADMAQVFRSWRKVLRANGQGVIIIGRKKLLGRMMPTERIFADLLMNEGFDVEILFKQKLVCNNTNAQAPWSTRGIQNEFILSFGH